MGIKKNRLSVNNRQPFLKATGIVFILIAIIIAQIPVPDVLASNIGTEFKMDGNKLVEYTGNKTSVSIPAKVVEIGAEAFADQESMEVLTIPESVTKIGSSAFSGCTSLKSVNLPDSIIEIDSSAFNDCQALTKVTIGKGLTTLGAGAFSDCDKLESITVSTDNSEFIFENGALLSKDKTILCQILAGKKADSFKIPDTVTVIMPYAFWGCDKIQSVSMSSAMNEIGPYAFSNCTSLKSVEIPYSVRSIQLKAFSDCISLNDAEVPDSVSYVHATAFDGCILLNNDNDTVSENEVQSDIQKNTENSVTSSTEIEAPDQSNSETSEKDIANEEIENKDTENTDEVILGKTIIVGKNAVILMNNQNTSVISGSMKSQDSLSANSIVSEDGTTIVKQSFYRDDTLKEYEIPNEVTKIEEFAFARSGLQKIIIPDSIQNIGYAAFYHCDDLNEIIIPSSVTEIGDKAFEKTPWMAEWRSNSAEEFLVAGDGILIAYKGSDQIVTIPDNVKQIASGAFEGNEMMEEIILTEQVWAIRDYAFRNCTNLKTVTGGEDITLLEEKAFEGTDIIMSNESVESPQNASVQNLGSYQILNKSDYNRDAMRMNLFKWGSISGMVVIGTILFMIRKKRS